MCTTRLRSICGAGMFIALLLVCCCTILRAVRRVQISVSHESVQGIDGRWNLTTHNATRHDTNRRTRPGADVHCDGCVISASTDADVPSESPGDHVHDLPDKTTVPVSFISSALYELRSRTHFQNLPDDLNVSMLMNGVAIGICGFFSACLICQSLRRNFEASDRNALPPPFEASSDGEASRRWKKLPSETDQAAEGVRRAVTTGSRNMAPRKTCPAMFKGYTYEPSFTSPSGTENGMDDDDETKDGLGEEHSPEPFSTLAMETQEAHGAKAPKSKKRLKSASH